jgi:hypothetical protein
VRVDYTGRVVWMPRGIVLAVLFSLTLSAHDVVTTKITWSREISRIAYRSCIPCHHEGGPAFPLVRYDQARPWAKAIKEEELSRRMPPWNAVKGFGEFRDDAGLTQAQISTIADWVEGGAPEGNPSYLPPAPRTAEPKDVLPAPGESLTVSGPLLMLTRPVVVAAIRAPKLPPGGTVLIVAVRPDGVAEPLLWVRNFNPAADRIYWLLKPVRLAAGSRIEVTPGGAGAVTIYTAAKPQ